MRPLDQGAATRNKGRQEWATENFYFGLNLQIISKFSNFILLHINTNIMESPLKLLEVQNILYFRNYRPLKK